MEKYSQVHRRPLLKAGGFIHYNVGKYQGFSVQLEVERTFRAKEFLTSGPRIEYTQFISDDYGGGDQNLYVGYAFKFYPLYWQFRKPYRGIFIGAEPLLLLKGPNDYDRYGPGLGSLLGYQHIFDDRISVGFDASMRYFQNLNDKAAKNNSADRYFSFFLSIHVGIKL